MELGINNEKLKNILTWNNLRKAFFDFLARWAKLLVFLAAALGTAYCAYLWYIFIYHPGWSEAQKQQYLETKGQGVIFDKSEFDFLVAAAKSRAAEEAKAPADVPDIFRLKSLIAPPGAGASSGPSAAAPNPPAAEN